MTERLREFEEQRKGRYRVIPDPLPEGERGDAKDDDLRPDPEPEDKGDGPTDEVVAVVRVMATVQTRRVAWLWRDWIPRGAITVLDGDPGLGKSTLTLDLAARVSRGWMMPPDGGESCAQETEPAGVLLFSAEDDPETTIRPRLDAAGADANRVLLMECVRKGEDDRPAVLPTDLDLLDRLIQSHDIRLVVVDPFMAYLDDSFDSHKDQQIRRALRQIATMAQRTGVAVLIVRHLNKLNGAPALYRGGGSIGIIGAARSALIVGRDPEERSRHILAVTKKNLGPLPDSLAYQLDTVTEDISRVGWLGRSDLHAEDILWHDQGRKPERPDTALQEAVNFLRQLLATGPVLASTGIREATRAGIAPRTLTRARQELGVVAGQLGTGWVWRMNA
jgi:hypothetical protein